MEIGRITSDSLEEFLFFRQEALGWEPASFRYTPRDDANIDPLSWKSRMDDGFVAAARHNDRLVGMGGLTPFKGDRLGHKGLIWGMYVHPDHRADGTADLLMSCLLCHARKSLDAIQLTVLSTNGRARRFYERHGFEQYGVEPRSVRLGDQLIDEVLMWLPLGGDQPAAIGWQPTW